MEKNKTIYLEILRVIACFFVVFNHTDGFHYFLKESYGMSLILHLFFSVVCKLSVPVFFMISGYLLLGKEESLSKIYTKRVLRMVVVLLITSAIIYYRQVILKGGTWYKFTRLFFQCKLTVTYWYMYSYIAFLMTLPYIRAIAKHLKNQDYYYLLALKVIFSSIVPFINYFYKDFWISSDFHLFVIFDKCIFFTLIGYWIGNIDIKKFTLKFCSILFALATFSIAFTIWIIIKTGSSGAYSDYYLARLDYVVAIALFVIVRKLLDGKTLNKFIAKTVSLIGSLTLGMYLLDPIMKPIIMDYYDFTKPGIFKGSFLYCLVSMFVCGTISLLVRLILKPLKIKLL